MAGGRQDALAGHVRVHVARHAHAVGHHGCKRRSQGYGAFLEIGHGRSSGQRFRRQTAVDNYPPLAPFGRRTLVQADPQQGVRGHVMRFAATLFGHATSHGPLAILTEAFVRYISRVVGLDGGSYVDDVIMALQMQWHGECDCYEGECERCRVALLSTQSTRHKRTICWMNSI